MKDIEINEKNLTIVLLCIAASFYYLEGVLFNPFIIWTAAPLYIGLSIFKNAYKLNSAKKLYAAFGFLIFGVVSSYFYHFAWYYDWGQIKTGSSTAGLIFVYFPFYSIIIGYIGYF